MDQVQAVLYTRQGCHLCEVAQSTLERHGLSVRSVDIDNDADSRVRAEYDQCVPVVWINGKERFRGKVDLVLLRRLINHERQDGSPSR